MKKLILALLAYEVGANLYNTKIASQNDKAFTEALNNSVIKDNNGNSAGGNPNLTNTTKKGLPTLFGLQSIFRQKPS